MSRIAPPLSKPYRPSLSQLTLAITLALSTPYALADDVIIVSKQDLGTLRADNSGESEVHVLSADGKVAGGQAHNDLNNGNRTVIWSGAGYTTKTDLGTLRADNSRRSYVYALSADGKVAGGWADNDLDDRRAVIWSGAGYATKTDLGTLEADNSGESEVFALSADGKVAGGSANGDLDYYRAVIWSGDNYATKTDLGTLKVDNSGWSWVRALSADGTVAGGEASNNLSDRRAVIWSGAGYTTKTDLGTLRADNLGGSRVYALSADGKVAGGDADNDLGNGRRAVIWSGEGYTTTTDLGTLRADNSGGSVVSALSADGKVAGGGASNDRNISWRAVIWSGDSYATKTDLGTLKANNSGYSHVHALSADGKVAGGEAYDDQNEWRATLWRLDYPTATPTTPQPTTPAVVSRIDVANTTQTINKLGADSFNLMAMQSHALDRMQYSCRVERGVCFGTQHDFTMSKDDNHHKTRDTAIGINAGYGFGNGVSVGVSLDHSLNRKLPDSYRHDGDDVGVGAVVRYQSPQGYFGEVSGAYDDYTATISRPLLANTELGVNKADIKGVSYGVKVGKEFGDSHRYRAYVGAKQRNISRDAYTENDNTAFPISYGKMEYKDTTATVGASANVKLGQKFAWVSDVVGEYRLNDDKPTYTASLTGTEKHDFGSQVTPEKWRGQVATGLRYYALPNTHLEVLPYVGVNATGNDYQGVTFRVESKF